MNMLKAKLFSMSKHTPSNGMLCKKPFSFNISAISLSDSSSHWSFAYYNVNVGNTGVVDGALILHMIS